MNSTPALPRIEATLPLVFPPAWALWERRLLDVMSAAVQPFAAKYTRPDGSLIWRDTNDDTYQSRDGADDFYESFYNWPLLYALGGSDELLPLAHHHWNGVTQQLTRIGLVHKEYERGYDQFHQGESMIFFYFLCLADPGNPNLQARARRFAGFYLNEDPEAPNYDREHHLIRAPHNGSGGPRWGYVDGDPSYGWYSYMAPYGLPYEDVPGITRYDDLRDPALARRMGEVMQERMGKGDVATNLIVTSLVANAFLMTGEDKYRDWIVDYVGAWAERAKGNGGFLPDNVGLNGVVGEYIGGKWYGGLYGWSWPHGYYNVCMAAILGGANAFLVTGNRDWLTMPREQIRATHNLGETRSLGSLAAEFGSFWTLMAQEHTPDARVFVAPYRHTDSGWFDYQTPSLVYPVAVWALTQSEEDWALVQQLRDASLTDWRAVLPFRNKEDAGHEQPWLCWLRGDNPGYPEAILSESYAKVARRMEMIRRDDADLSQVSIHHWQELNPVTTEALVQLTLGAPQIIYNGGLLFSQVRYFDASRRRPGLPHDVAALVEQIDSQGIALHLVNLSVLEARELLVQAGAFGEHTFVSARFETRTSDYPGAHGAAGYAAPFLETRIDEVELQDSLLHVVMPPGTELRLTLTMSRFSRTPSSRLPWERLSP